jgi:hypothetical protein
MISHCTKHPTNTRIYCSECFNNLSSQLAEAREVMKEIRLRAEHGRDFNKGHFCDARSNCQSIVALSEQALAKMKGE